METQQEEKEQEQESTPDLPLNAKEQFYERLRMPVKTLDRIILLLVILLIVVLIIGILEGNRL